jgi:type I restriction enzyme S subunit
MEGYSQTKLSKSNWIDNIPNSWKEGNLNYFSEFVMGQAPHSDTYNKDRIGEVFIKTGDFGEISPTVKWYTTNPLVYGRESDVFICVVGATAGKVNKGINGTISRSVAALRPKKNVLRDFLFYFLQYNYVELNNMSEGSAQGIININILSSIILPVPPLQEQAQIVAFLDDKTAKIDDLLVKTKKKIELLKEKRTALINQCVTKGLNPNAPMKDSGVEWIGEIPIEWEMVKIKYISDIFGRIGFRGYTTEDIVDEGEGVVTISPSNIKNDRFNLFNNTYLSYEKYYESPEIMIFENDIILVKTGSTIGKTAIIPKGTPEMTINPQLVVLKNVIIFPKFLYYQTICRFIKESFDVEQTGSTTPTISQHKVNEFPIVKPTYEQQQQIVEYLDEQTSKIDATINKEEKRIELLKEYRQSLISNVVTGKIKVCN